MSKGSRNRKERKNKKQSRTVTCDGCGDDFTPNEQYQMIADAAGLGWLHLPSQDQFDQMQEERGRFYEESEGFSDLPNADAIRGELDQYIDRWRKKHEIK